MREGTADKDVRLLKIFRVFFYSGATTFGGMWAATRKLEKDLVDRARYIKADQLQTSFLLATLIPAPRFLSLGGLVGFRAGGWLGSLLATTGLLLPPSLLVLAGALIITPAMLGGPLAQLNRSVSIAVVGLLFANAYLQLRQAKASWRNRVLGLSLSAALFLAIVAGVPLIAVAFGGFLFGGVLIRRDTAVPDAQPGPGPA